MSRFRRLLRWTLLAFAGAILLGLFAVGTLYYVGLRQAARRADACATSNCRSRSTSTRATAG